MARLVVEAQGVGGDNRTSGVARPGNRDPLHLMVSVTRNSGLPVTGLSLANFQANCPIVAAGGGAVTVDWIDEPQAGVYRLNVVPIPTATWLQGTYIFWVAVQSGANQSGTNHGQALCLVPVS